MRKIDSKKDNVQRKKIGGKWKPLVMFLLYSKPERFNKMKQLLKTISANQLTRCVREMEEDKIITRHEDIYSLTPAGHKITKLMFEIKTIVDSLD